MSQLVFFYGTLMTPFNRAGRRRVDHDLAYAGRGTISGVLFDLGIYPAAVPAADSHVWGEVYEMSHPTIVLQALDELEGFRAAEPESSLYTRMLTPVTLEDGRVVLGEPGQDRQLLAAGLAPLGPDGDHQRTREVVQGHLRAATQAREGDRRQLVAGWAGVAGAARLDAGSLLERAQLGGVDVEARRTEPGYHEPVAAVGSAAAQQAGERRGESAAAENHADARSRTCSAKASDAVRPGDSMP